MKSHRQDPGYLKLSVSFPSGQVFGDRISTLGKSALTGGIINNTWCFCVEESNKGKSIVNIVWLTSFKQARNAVFIIFVAMENERVWWTSLKGLGTNAFFSGQSFVNFFKLHLKRGRIERQVLSS